MSSWFQSANIASLAKNALKEAQKTIDKALDINHDSVDGHRESTGAEQNQFSQITSTVSDAASDFFNSWGVIPPDNKKPDSLPSSSSDPKSAVVSSPPSSGVKASSNQIVSEKKRRTKSRSRSLRSSESDKIPLPVQDGEFKSCDNMVQIDLEDSPTLPPPVNEECDKLELDPKVNKESCSQHSVQSSDSDFQFVPEANWVQQSKEELNEFNSEKTSAEADTGSEKHDVENVSNSNTFVSLFSADTPLIQFEESSTTSQQTATEVSNSDNEMITKVGSLTSLRESEDKNIPLEVLYSCPSNVPFQKSSEDLCADKTNSLSEDEETQAGSLVLLTSDSSEANTISATDLESSSATIMQESCDNSENSDANEEKETDLIKRPDPTKTEVEVTEDNEENQDRLLSPKITSPSSLTMSSISIISEEKNEEFDSHSHSSINSVSGPSSPNEHPDYSVVMSIKSAALARHEQPSTNSTPEGGHSRSNSTSSSVDQQHHPSHGQHNPRANTSPVQHQHHYYHQNPGQSGKTHSNTNFPLSSASSSDIEVIPLDSLDSSTTMLYNPSIVRRVSVTEVETQTDEPPEQQPASSKVSVIVEEKDFEIAQLREEGIKLSKKEAKLSEIIKKLRAKEKETEGVVKNLKNDIDSKSIEIERLMKSFVSKESIEQKQVQTISKLNSEKAQLEGVIDDLKSKLEDSDENCASMKASLEDASIEILELRNTISTAQQDSTHIDLLTREKSDLLQQNQSFQKEIEQLRSSVTFMQNKSSIREQELKTQLHQYVQKIQSLETQLGDMTDEIADATMPLSIQIEKLQSEIKSNELQFQRREKQLNDQLTELDLRLKQTLEREKASQDFQMDYKGLIKQLENQVDHLEADNKLLKLEVDTLKQDKIHLSKKCHSIETEFQQQQQQLTNSKIILDKLESDLKSKNLLYENEKKKCLHLTEQLKLNQQQQQQQSIGIGGDGSGNTSPDDETIRSHRSSESSYLEEVFDTNNGNNNNNQNHVGGGLLTPRSSTSVFDSLPIYNNHLASSASPFYLENLYSQLRLRENELIQLQSEAMKNEKIRKTLNDEIAKLTVENQQLDSKLEQLNHVQDKLKEVEKNYNAVLQLYGEKVEEVEELRLDLADVKEMFKNQIEQLVRK